MATIATSRTQKRDRIVEAAISVFAEKGFHSARVSDIAQRAGVADGTIYLYFRNKEDLLLTIFEEKMGLLLVELREELEGVESPIEAMRVYAHHHFHQLQLHPELAQVFQVELRQSHRFFRDYRPERLWEYLGVFGQAVERGQEQGLVRSDVDPFVAMWAFFGALDEISIQWVLSRKRDRFDLEIAAKQVVDMFLHGVLVRPNS